MLRSLGIPLAMLVAGSGCLGARRQLIETRTASHVYPVPAKALVNAVASSMPNRSFELKWTPRGYVLHSAWAPELEAAEIATMNSRIIAEVHPVGRQRSTLVILKMTQQSTNEEGGLEAASDARFDQSDGMSHRISIANANPNEWHNRVTRQQRDYAAEWKVMEAADPRGARGILAEASRR